MEPQTNPLVLAFDLLILAGAVFFVVYAFVKIYQDKSVTVYRIEHKNLLCGPEYRTDGTKYSVELPKWAAPLPPMPYQRAYSQGGQWFACCDSLETLGKIFKPEVHETLEAKGFVLRQFTIPNPYDVKPAPEGHLMFRRVNPTRRDLPWSALNG